MALATEGDRPWRETAEQAYGRIARRKLRERGVPDDRIEAELEEIMRTDIPFRFDLPGSPDDGPIPST